MIIQNEEDSFKTKGIPVKIMFSEIIYQSHSKNTLQKISFFQLHFRFINK